MSLSSCTADSARCLLLCLLPVREIKAHEVFHKSSVVLKYLRFKIYNILKLAEEERILAQSDELLPLALDGSPWAILT